MDYLGGVRLLWRFRDVDNAVWVLLQPFGTLAEAEGRRARAVIGGTDVETLGRVQRGEVMFEG